MTQEEFVLEEELDLIKINSKNDVSKKLKKIGLVIKKYLYIIDPYLHDPSFLKHIIEIVCKQFPLLEIKIIFNYKICNEKKQLNYEDIQRAYYDYSVKQNRYNITLKSYCDEKGHGFHDRFLFTELRCWNIGSSFNELGANETYIIDVDYPRLTFDRTGIKKSDILLVRFKNIWGNLSEEIFSSDKYV